MVDGHHAKRKRFCALHRRQGVFIMPNAWDRGSAVVLARAGFDAIGTTSAGIAFAAGFPDHQRIPKQVMLAKIEEIVCAVEIPVNVDLEAGYATTPAGVATTVEDALAFGAAGANLEDASGDHRTPLFSLEEAVDRVAAAVAVTRGTDFVLTARCDAVLVGAPGAVAESIRRCCAYVDAGADCVFVPGISDADTAKTIVSQVPGPINVVMGLSGNPLTVAVLGECGVRRVSTGGSLARAALGLVRRAAQEMRRDGSFSFASEQYDHAALCELFDQ